MIYSLSRLILSHFILSIWKQWHVQTKSVQCAGVLVHVNRPSAKWKCDGCQIKWTVDFASILVINHIFLLHQWGLEWTPDVWLACVHIAKLSLLACWGWGSECAGIGRVELMDILQCFYGCCVPPMRKWTWMQTAASCLLCFSWLSSSSVHPRAAGCPLQLLQLRSSNHWPTKLWPSPQLTLTKM